MEKTQKLEISSWAEDTTSEASVKVLRPQVKQRHALLRQLNGPGAPQDLHLGQETLVIGRSNNADVAIDSADLSRRHLQIELIDDDFRCTDLNSVNGLFLNGIRVHACTLRRGDTIQAGQISFQFEEVEG